MTRTRPSCAAVALLLLSSCTPVQSYVQADRAIHDAIAPAHRAYVIADPGLNLEQKERRLRTLDRWRELIETAEAPATRPMR